MVIGFQASAYDYRLGERCLWLVAGNLLASSCLPSSCLLRHALDRSGGKSRHMTAAVDRIPCTVHRLSMRSLMHTATQHTSYLESTSRQCLHML